MATGDQADILARLKAVVPPWFGDANPILDAMLQGLAWAGSFVYTLISYTRLQTRIKTATDGWLDMIAADFFGSSLMRAAHQSDASFRARIIINLFRERGTRNAIVRVLQDLTGRTPLIFEPLRPADTGGWGQARGLAYGMAGGYGSMLLPYQGFVTAFRPTGSGIPTVGGYGEANYGATSGGPGGYGVGAIEYASMDMIQGAVTDADIYAAIDSVKPVGTIAWTRIES